jgi:hypothetical protein
LLLVVVAVVGTQGVAAVQVDLEQAQGLPLLLVLHTRLL